MAARIKKLRRNRPDLVIVVQCLPDCESWKLPADWADDMRRQCQAVWGPDTPIIVCPPGVIIDTMTRSDLLDIDDDGDDEEDDGGDDGDGGAVVPVPAGK